MRNLLIALGVLAAAVGAPEEARAGDRDRGHRGGFIVVTGRGRTDRYRQDYAPQRRRHHPQSRFLRHRRYLVPGRFVTQAYQEWVPGAYRYETVAPTYREYRDSYGRIYRVMVYAGYTRSFWVGGYFETRYRQVWIPPRWSRTR